MNSNDFETGDGQNLGCMDQIKLSSIKINDVIVLMEGVKDFVTSKHRLGQWEFYMQTKFVSKNKTDADSEHNETQTQTDVETKTLTKIQILN